MIIERTLWQVLRLDGSVGDLRGFCLGAGAYWLWGVGKNPDVAFPANVVREPYPRTTVSEAATGMDAPEVQITFQWDAKEHAWVVQRMTRQQYSSGGWLVALLLGGGWVLWQVGELVVAAVRNPDPTLMIAAAPWTIFLALWAWFLTHGSGWIAARQLKKLDPDRTGKLVHRFDATGLSVDSGSGSSNLPWSGMSRIVETPRCILWYWNARMAHYTPKRAMHDDELAIVLQLIRAQAPERAELISA